MQLHLKTEHLQSADVPDSSGLSKKSTTVMLIVILYFLDEKPNVECSFITEFEDHIFVTVDAEAFFFLHDLITSYLKEKERVVSIFKEFRNN